MKVKSTQNKNNVWQDKKWSKLIEGTLQTWYSLFFQLYRRNYAQFIDYYLFYANSIVFIPTLIQFHNLISYTTRIHVEHWNIILHTAIIVITYFISQRNMERRISLVIFVFLNCYQAPSLPSFLVRSKHLNTAIPRSLILHIPLVCKIRR